VDMTEALAVSPSEVDDELNKRLNMSDEEIINNRYENTWDLRSTDFNCQSDTLSGNFYMIDRV